MAMPFLLGWCMGRSSQVISLQRTRMENWPCDLLHFTLVESMWPCVSHFSSSGLHWYKVPGCITHLRGLRVKQSGNTSTLAFHGVVRHLFGFCSCSGESLGDPLLRVDCTSFFSYVYDRGIHIAISLRITKITHVRVKQRRDLQAQHTYHIYCPQFPKEITSAKGKGHLQNPNPKFQLRLSFSAGYIYTYTIYIYCSLTTRRWCLYFELHVPNTKSHMASHLWAATSRGNRAMVDLKRIMAF